MKDFIMSAAKIAFFIYIFLFIGGCISDSLKSASTKNDVYTGYYYPDQNDLDDSVKTGNYKTKENCLDGIRSFAYYDADKKFDPYGISKRDITRYLNEIENESPNDFLLSYFKLAEYAGFDVNNEYYEKAPYGECGLNCKYNPTYGLNVCEETYDI